MASAIAMSMQSNGPGEDLAEAVRHHQAQAMIGAACLIASFPESSDRCREAQRQITMAMVEYTVGRLTDEERSRILEILHPCCPEAFEWKPPPLPPDLAGLYGASEEDT